MPPYKKQVISADIPQIQQYDATRAFNAMADTARNISEETAKLSQKAFINKYEIQSRKMLMEAYERNADNPQQLLNEQQKIKVNLLQGIPSDIVRDEAAARFDIQAMPYFQKAKDNLYKRTAEEAEVSTLQDIQETISAVEYNSAALYDDNTAVSGATIAATIADADRIIKNISTPDERGNYYLTPQQRVAVKDGLNRALTAGARNYFDGLPSTAAKMSFAKKYAAKEVKINVADPNSETGFNKVGIEKITDRAQYEANLNYFKTFFTKSAEPKTDPNVYIALETDINNGNFDQKKINWAYTSGNISLTDKRQLEEQANGLIPSAKKQAVSLINAKFSTSNMDARFGDINYTREKALQSFYQKVQLNPKATDVDIMNMANESIDEYEMIDSDNMISSLPVPKDARETGFTKKDMSNWTTQQLDEKIKNIQNSVRVKGNVTQDDIITLSQYNEWYPYLEKKAKKAKQIGVK